MYISVNKYFIVHSSKHKKRARTHNVMDGSRGEKKRRSVELVHTHDDVAQSEAFSRVTPRASVYVNLFMDGDNGEKLFSLSHRRVLFNFRF